MSAPQLGQVATSWWQAGHLGGERFLCRGTIETLTPGNVSTFVMAQRYKRRSPSLAGSYDP